MVLQQPIGASQSVVQVVNSTFTTGQINITIANTSLNSPLASHPNFAAFSTYTDQLQQYANFSDHLTLFRH
jgi:hypothetical protein